MSDIGGIDSRIRMTGLATGLDTDGMIKKMMAAENVRLDKMKQDRQYVQWRQDGLRDIIKDFRDLRSSYLLLESPSDTNMIKSGAYSGSTITCSDDTNPITATALPGANNGVSTVTVKQLAKGAKIGGAGLNLSGEITDVSKLKGATIEFNGKAITLDSSFSDMDGLVKNINDKIPADLSGKISVAKETIGGKDYIRFNQITDDSIKITGAKDSGGNPLTELSGIINGELSPSLNTKLKDLGITSPLSFKIKQGTKESSEISIDGDKTIQDLINAINNANSDGTSTSSSAAKLYGDLQVGYSDLTKSLTIQSRKTGSSQSIQLIASGANTDKLAKLGLDVNERKGQDAMVEITPPGSSVATTVVKSTNNFTVDNVTYNLVKDPNGKEYSVNLTTKADSQKSYEKIKGFIDKYNALVEKIYNKVDEKKNYNYKPLTDDQKKDMKEDEIKIWEEKAQQGILKNDSDLQNILYSMRNAFSEGVKSAGISLQEIGIDTYGGLQAISKPGQLTIDENKLKSALETRGDQVMKIFTTTPSKDPIPADVEANYKSKYGVDKWQDRYNYDNTGIFTRLENIINQSAVKFDGNLLKKAGYKGTSSEATNNITKQLKDQNKAIDEMNKKLAAKQEKYYQMFARLEKAMSQMNSQQAWLGQQLGGGR